jgi:ABC-2 type transport system ATP-binding protein
VVSGYPIVLTDSHTLEVAVDKNKSLNQLFSMLSEQGIETVSMRNKANRLEELFIDMVEKNLDKNEGSQDE